MTAKPAIDLPNAEAQCAQLAELIRPHGLARVGTEGHDVAGREGDDDLGTRHGGADVVQHARLLRDAAIAPNLGAVLGVETEQAALDGDGIDAAIGHRRGGARRS